MTSSTSQRIDQLVSFLSTEDSIEVLCARHRAIMTESACPSTGIHLWTDPPCTYDATLVDGYDRPYKFVCCRSPGQTDIKKFWQLVWQLNCSTIVALGEFPSDQSPLYFNRRMGHAAHYGPFCVITGHTEVPSTNGLVNVLLGLECEASVSAPVRRVRHLSFEHWPADSTDVLELIWMLNFDGREENRPPILLHDCTEAGMGVLVALDWDIRRLQATGEIDVCDTVTQIHEQRRMLTNKKDFVFVHVALLQSEMVTRNPLEISYGDLLEVESDEPVTASEMEDTQDTEETDVETALTFLGARASVSHVDSTIWSLIDSDSVNTESEDSDSFVYPMYSSSSSYSIDLQSEESEEFQ